jgi:hypothetical protein
MQPTVYCDRHLARDAGVRPCSRYSFHHCCLLHVLLLLLIHGCCLGLLHAAKRESRRLFERCQLQRYVQYAAQVADPDRSSRLLSTLFVQHLLLVLVALGVNVT